MDKKIFIVGNLIAEDRITDVAFMFYKEIAREDMYKRPLPEKKGKTICCRYVIDNLQYLSLFFGNTRQQFAELMKNNQPVEYFEKGIEEIMSYHSIKPAMMCEKFGMSRQSMRDWVSGRSTPPVYVLNMIEWFLSNHKDYQFDETASIKKLCEIPIFTCAYISDIVGIPVRTIEDWKSGRRNPTKYVESLIYAYMKDLDKVGAAEDRKNYGARVHRKLEMFMDGPDAGGIYYL